MTTPNENQAPAELVSMMRVWSMCKAMMVLTDEERELVFDRFFIPKDKERRLRERDRLIRIIWKSFPIDDDDKKKPNDDRKSRRIEALFKRYLSGRWQREQEIPMLTMETANWFDSLWHQLARFNLGKSLSYRQIINIKDGLRSGN